jgi:acyl-CoA thioesterase I
MIVLKRVFRKPKLTETIRMRLASFVSLTLILALYSARVLQGQQSAGPPVKLEGKWICVGDSITAGEGVTPAQCYVGLLKARAKAEHLNLNVIGQGRSGWSTGSYLGNKDAIVNAMPADATIVSILLGTNDSHEDGSPEEVARRAVANLGTLIDLYQAKAPNAQIIVIAPTNAFPEILTKRLLNAHYGTKTPVNLKAIRDQFEALAKQRGLTFIDLSDMPSSPEKSIDGIHPKAAGHQEMFDAIWASVSGAQPTTKP